MVQRISIPVSPDDDGSTPRVVTSLVRGGPEDKYGFQLVVTNFCCAAHAIEAATTISRIAQSILEFATGNLSEETIAMLEAGEDPHARAN